MKTIRLQLGVGLLVLTFFAAQAFAGQAARLGRIAEPKLNRTIDQQLDKSLDQRVERGLGKKLARGLDRNVQKGLNRNLQKGLDRKVQRGLDRNLQKGLDQKAQRGLDRMGKDAAIGKSALNNGAMMKDQTDQMMDSGLKGASMPDLGAGKGF